MRFIKKSLLCAVLMGFASGAIASTALVSINANDTGWQNGLIKLTAAGASFPDPKSCNGYTTQTSNVALKADDPDFKQMYALALAAFLKNKNIDVTVSTTGNAAIDCVDLGGWGIPVITGITVIQ